MARTKPTKKVEEVKGVCGHVNMHSPEHISCILEKGHAGDHTDGTEFGWWSDAAGTPPKPYIITPEEDERRKHGDNQRLLNNGEKA